ncbi:hypothetical protein GCM10009545_26530 [Saccharopolyspora thermophila]|uniref:Type I-E CRISPR-associated protein Cas5/CasD n=1 Tax=Saccharopolyspora thermophila TaxID=89367 RepID=A0ABN1CP72_9PSEU
MLLRLAGPLQSWGERSTFDTRDTAGFPTRSGLLGMIACALGRRRGESLEDLAPLVFTIRIDRPGIRLIDYHTAGGGLPSGVKIPTADGKGRPEGKGTVQTWREYLADAVFTVAIEGPDTLLDEIRRALIRPRWQPFLGRRSCPPDQPLLLDVTVDDPVAELHQSLPLARQVTDDDTEVSVEFVRATGDPEHIRSEIYDIPTTFTPVDRTYRPRPVWIEKTMLPADLGVRRLRDYPARLAAYVRERQ